MKWKSEREIHFHGSTEPSKLNQGKKKPQTKMDEEQAFYARLAKLP